MVMQGLMKSYIFSCVYMRVLTQVRLTSGHESSPNLMWVESIWVTIRVGGGGGGIHTGGKLGLNLG